MILNYFKVKDLTFKHKQIEMKDGLVYMRMKSRGFFIVKNARVQSS